MACCAQEREKKIGHLPGETAYFYPAHLKFTGVHLGTWEIYLNKVEFEVLVCDNPDRMVLQVVIPT